MIICHVSDLHGELPELPEDFDIIVNSGDWMPTKGRRMGERVQPRHEYNHQAHWIYDNLDEIRAWTRGKPMLFCPGNHCFYNPVPALQANGINAIDLCERTHEIDGVTFYGFPWVPYMEGEWSREAQAHEMAEHVKRIPDVDILISHAPPYGFLDMEDGQYLGITALSNSFLYDGKRWPTLLLCGHIHASFGVTQWRGMTIVNSATGYHLVESPKSKTKS